MGTINNTKAYTRAMEEAKVITLSDKTITAKLNGLADMNALALIKVLDQKLSSAKGSLSYMIEDVFCDMFYVNGNLTLEVSKYPCGIEEYHRTLIFTIHSDGTTFFSLGKDWPINLNGWVEVNETIRDLCARTTHLDEELQSELLEFLIFLILD